MNDNARTCELPTNDAMLPTRSRRAFLRWSLSLAATLGGAVVTTCGSDGRADGDREVTVAMTDEMTFEPQRITVSPGTVVVFRNTGDSMVHTATGDPDVATDPSLVSLPQGVDRWNSGDVPPGESWSMRFETAGSYTYVCLPHELAGMTGEIIVEAE